MRSPAARAVAALVVLSPVITPGVALAEPDAAAPAPAPAESAEMQTVPFPHPVISEVLAAVPAAPDGPDAAPDPSGDGVRHPVGDEFVELVNPHDLAIDLTGYVIADALAVSSPADERGVRFVFPRFTLGPGECVVVFNGYETAIEGPHGHANEAPTERNDALGGAWAFSMLNATRVRALNNADELVVLFDPSGAPVDAVVWGEPTTSAPDGCLRVAGAPRPRMTGSLVRVSPDAPIVRHAKVAGASGASGATGAPWSPGVAFAGARADAETAAAE